MTNGKSETEIPRPRLQPSGLSFLPLAVPFASRPFGGVVPPTSAQLLYLQLVVVDVI